MTKQEEYILKDLHTYKFLLYDMAHNRTEVDCEQIAEWIERLTAEINGMLEEYRDRETTERLLKLKQAAETLKIRANNLRDIRNKQNKEQEEANSEV